MKLNKLFEEWSDADFCEWFFTNLQRQSDGCSLYPNLFFINRVESKRMSILEIWQEGENMELLYKKEKQWENN